MRLCEASNIVINFNRIMLMNIYYFMNAFVSDEFLFPEVPMKMPLPSPLMHQLLWRKCVIANHSQRHI